MTNQVFSLSKVLDGFRTLRGSPRELSKAYLLKFLDSYSYFSFSLILTLFLSSDFGYSDTSSGTIYGAWGASFTLFGLATGVVIDNLGVARCLRLGYAITLLSRCLIFATTSRAVLLFAMGLLALGSCLGIPVLTVGIRRYTTEANRGFAFGLFYVIMNVAALLSGPSVDLCTILYKGNQDEEGMEEGVVPEWSLTGYRLIILLGIIANIIAVLITLSVKEIKVSEISSQDNAQQVSTFQPKADSAKQIFLETIQSKDFCRFLVVCLITLNVKMIFRHLDATLPKYMMREFGDNVPKGTIYAINPALIMILVPIITAATTNIDPLVMIHNGSYISAASVFFLAISTSIPACVLFVIVLSIGEAIWSPRLYDYSMKIAKEGREGTYMALTSAPLFLAKLPVGFMSGYLLQKYCPEDGARNSKMMWLIIGLTTATSPIMMTVFWKYLSKKEGNEYHSAPTSEMANSKKNDMDEDVKTIA